MSFGKDRTAIPNMPSFRDQQAMMKNRGGGGGGGGGGFFWKHLLRITDSMAEPPDKIRLFRGDYAVKVADQTNTVETLNFSFVPYTEHGRKVDGRYRSAICSGGPLSHKKDLRDPCFGCEEHYRDRESMSRHSKYAYTAMHLHLYAKVPDTDEHGRPRMNERTQEPYYTWQPTSEALLRRDHKGLEVRDYHLGVLSLGYKDNELLNSWNSDVGHHCVNCMTPKSIKTLVWACSHCGESIVDMNETSLDAKEIAEMVTQEGKCGACNNVGYLEEVLECSGCSKPRRAEIFDGNLLMRQPKDTKTNKRGGLVITEFEFAPLDPKYFVAPSAEAPAPFHQLDIQKLFAPISYDKQVELFAGGRASSTPSRGARPWGK